MTAPLDDALLGRVIARATDPATRTDAPPTRYGGSETVGSLTVQGLDLGSVLGGRAESGRLERPPLPAPADEAALVAAERELGLRLPAALRQLYLDVADGGFGPGDGLLPVREVVLVYLELRVEPPGPNGEKWPAGLLPLTRTNPGHECIDLDTGAIVYWDEERLAEEEWDASFVPDAPDLATWLGRWLERPAPGDVLRDQLQAAMLNGIRESLEYWRGKTPEERAAFGLPEVGWEEELFGHLGIDLRSL